MPWSGASPNQTATRTDGTRTGGEVWQEAAAVPVGIVPTDHDQHDQDLATMINSCLKKDGGNQPSANLPMNGFKHTGVAVGTARDHYAALSQVQDSTVLYAGTSSGTDTITATLSPAILAYVAGQRYHFKAGGTNTGAATININSLGAKDIKKGPDGTTALAAGDITAGGVYTVAFDGTNMQLAGPNAPLSGVTLAGGLELSGATLRVRESFVIACSDETTNLTTGTAKVTFRMPYAFTLTGVRASVNTAPTGSTIIVDINEAGSTILSTKLSIDASEETSTTAASAPVISDTALADDAEITVDIDQVGSSTPGKGLKVVLLGFRP